MHIFTFANSFVVNDQMIGDHVLIVRIADAQRTLHGLLVDAELLADLEDGIDVDDAEVFGRGLGKEVVGQTDLEPFVFANVLDRCSLQRIDREHLLDELSHWSTQIVGRGVGTRADLLEQHLNALVVEWQRAGE